MIARASQLYLPTLRDAPADAEAVSHKLLVRAGFIRQVGAGLWSFTPLGWRAHRKVEQIVREEMEAIGAQEWLAPVLTPLELWEATGRDRIPERFRGRPRGGARRPARARVPGAARCARGSRDAGCEDDRGHRRAPCGRRDRDVEGDAGDEE